MAEDGSVEPVPSGVLGIIDRIFDKASSYLSDRISAFVAFIFVMIALGTFYGTYFVPRFPNLEIYLLLAPLGLALIAYYNRTFATILFAAILLVVVLL